MVTLGKQQRSSTFDPLGQRLKEFAMPIGDLQQLLCALVVICLQPESSFDLGDRVSQLLRLLYHLKPPKKFAPLLKFLVITRVMAYAHKIKRVPINKEQLSWLGEGIVEKSGECLIGKKVLRTRETSSLRAAAAAQMKIADDENLPRRILTQPLQPLLFQLERICRAGVACDSVDMS